MAVGPSFRYGHKFLLILNHYIFTILGATIGHRSLMRFYRQRLKPENQLQVVSKRSKLPAVLSQYRALGWTGTSGKIFSIYFKKLFYQLPF